MSEMPPSRVSGADRPDLDAGGSVSDAWPDGATAMTAKTSATASPAWSLDLPFRVSARVDYAVRALTEIAASGGAPVTGQRISRAQAIPLKFLQSILAELRRAGLVRSHRGSAAGYELARPPTARPYEAGVRADARPVIIAAVLDCGAALPLACRQPSADRGSVSFLQYRGPGARHSFRSLSGLAPGIRRGLLRRSLRQVRRLPRGRSPSSSGTCGRTSGACASATHSCNRACGWIRNTIGPVLRVPGHSDGKSFVVESPARLVPTSAHLALPVGEACACNERT